tara:strand:+ start:149 stop:340 length:192 start_codon:yes stop_codon:yes gene_type:complete
MMNHNFIYLLHVLVAGPLFIYAGYKGQNLSQTEGDKNFFLFFIFMGLMVMSYHGYKLYLVNKY